MCQSCWGCWLGRETASWGLPGTAVPSCEQHLGRRLGTSIISLVNPLLNGASLSNQKGGNSCPRLDANPNASGAEESSLLQANGFIHCLLMVLLTVCQRSRMFYSIYTTDTERLEEAQPLLGSDHNGFNISKTNTLSSRYHRVLLFDDVICNTSQHKQGQLIDWVLSFQTHQFLLSQALQCK